MKAALLYGPSDLRVVEVDRPQPKADQALVRVVRCGLYGTDLGTYLNKGEIGRASCRERV